MRPLIACLLIAPLLIGGCDRQSSSQEQANAVVLSGEVPSSATAAPPAAGTVDRSHKGEAPPAVTFADAAGRPVTLASFRGKPVLLNLWATWCGPCVAEMPTLDALATRAGGTLAVVAVSQDMEGAKKVAPFVAKAGFKTLKPYLDAKLGLSLGYQVNLPTSVLLDAQGKEVWRVAGGMDWASAPAAKLLAEAS